MRGRHRAGLLAAALTIGLAAAPATAAPKAATAHAKAQITDPSGDANAVNSQGNHLFQGLSTPIDDAPADMTSVVFRTLHKKMKVHHRTVVVPYGFSVTMTLSAPPDSLTAYEIQASSPAACDGFFQFLYSNAAQPLNVVQCTHNNLGVAKTTTLPAHAAVVGKTIVWTVSPKAISVGRPLDNFRAFTSLEDGPDIDQAFGALDATYWVGS